MMTQYYSIGGFLLKVEGDHMCALLASMRSFETFRIECTDGVEPVCEFAETQCAPPAFEQVIYQLEDLDTVFSFGYVAGGYRMSQAQNDGKHLDLWTVEDGKRMFLSGDWELQMLRSVMWTGFGIQTVPLGAIPVHSSCIVNSDEAVMCLGESGTGKSTHTRLWRQYIAGSHLLNDDCPILRVEDGKVWVYGSPWSGKTPCYRAERYPLKACIRLSQAPENSIRRLTVLQAYAALHPSCPPAFAYDAPLYDAMSRTLGEVLGRVQCYHLACRPDEEAAQLSYQTIFGE